MADNIDRDTHDHDLTYENEQSTVTIPLKEYDRLKDQSKYIYIYKSLEKDFFIYLMPNSEISEIL